MDGRAVHILWVVTMVCGLFPLARVRRTARGFRAQDGPLQKIAIGPPSRYLKAQLFCPNRVHALEGRFVLDALAFPIPAGFRLLSSEQVRGGEGVPVRVAHPDPGLRLCLAPVAPMPRGWYRLELRFPTDGLVDVVAKL